MLADGLNRAGWMMNAFCVQIRLSGQLVGIKCTKPCLASWFALYLRAPFIVPENNTLRAMPVHGVFGRICFSKVGQPIVGTNPVNVINLANRKFSVHIKPRESVRPVVFAKNRNTEIPVSVFGALCNLLLPIRNSCKYASHRIIGYVGEKQLVRHCDWLIHLGGIGKVSDAVVSFPPVNMPDGVYRELSVNVEPCKPVGEVQPVVNLANGVTVISDAPRLISGLCIRGGYLPGEDASFWVVVKQLAQTLCGKIGLSHDTVPSGSRSCFKVLNESANTLKAVTDSAQSQVAVEAQKTSNLPGFVAMIDVQLLRDSPANSTPVLLHGVQRSVLLDRQAIALAQTLCPGLGGRASLVGVFSQAFRLLGRSTLVALSSVAVTVTRTNAELIDRFIAIASAACFNLKSHDTTTSLIGQRPARVISTGGLRYFITHACSGAMGITKCLHQAALAAASVCMPANHRRLSNPLGALTPFNAL